jgi:LysM repeat protein
MKTNNPSPLVPQGTLPDNRGKSRVQFTVLTILAVHAVVLGVVLLQGCKRTATDPNLELQALATNYPPPEAFAPPPSPTRPPTEVVQIPPQPTSIPQPTPVDPQPSLGATTTTQPEPLPALPNGGASQHVIVKDDSFSTIAKKYGVTVRAIAEANPGVDSRRLKIGQKVTVPPPSVRTASGATSSATNGDKTYVVKSGDTLFKIAKSHGTTPKALRTANRLRTDQIKVGQKLLIPGKNGSPTIEAGVGGTGSQTAPLP